MHADVAEVSQEYIFNARKLCNIPRKLLFAIESVVLRKCPEDLLYTFPKLPLSSSQVPFHRSVDL